MSLVTHHLTTTPFPTLHPQSLFTLAHHRRRLVFPGWIRQHAYIRLRGGSPAGGVTSKRVAVRKTSQVDLRFRSEFLVFTHGLTQEFGTEAVHRRIAVLFVHQTGEHF